MNCGTRRYTYKNPLFFCQLHSCFISIFIRYFNDFIYENFIIIFRDKTCTYSLNFMKSGFTAVDYGGIFRFYTYYFYGFYIFFQNFRNSRNGSSRTYTCNKYI